MVFGWLPLLVAVQAEPSCDDLSISFLQNSMSFLQNHHSLQQRSDHMTTRPVCGHLISGSEGDPATFFNNNCKYHIHGDECKRPIPDVMAEHPDMDGYCYFSEVAMYINYSPPSDDPNQFVTGPLAGCLSLRSEYKGLNTGPLVTYHFNGKDIKTRIDSENYIYDDLYGYSLGLLQGQGRTVEQLKNPAVWEELAKVKCQELQDTYNFKHEELILEDILDMNMPLMAMSHCSAAFALPVSLRFPYVTDKAKYHSITDCQSVTSREFARHHYMKCLMGTHNAAADAAYLFARACLLDNGTRISHFADCPFDLEKEAAAV